MTQLFANNATSTLAGSLTNVATSFAVASGEGARFPALSSPDFYRATIFQIVAGVEVNHEIVKVTARASDTFTVVRGQDGTTANAFSAGDPVQLRLTSGDASNLCQGAAKAWVNFNGTGTVAIRDSFNVNSITDNAVGNYTINIASGALANANFCAAALSGGTAGNISMVAVDEQTARTTTLLRVAPLTTSFAGFDCAQIGITIFGD